jgi:pimeloyl-ACP methyl ester carboxylesterase
LRFVFNISRNDDGTLSATLDSPDQGATGIPVDEVSLMGGAFHLAINGLGAAFDGSLNDKGVLNGYWKQSGASLVLKMERTEERPKLNRPQEPKPPFPYREEHVTFENKEDDVTLAGTLLIPDGEGPFPAVAFCTGSGRQDRDETIYGHKPFWILADHLSRNGIATLRYDDRGVMGSTGDFDAASSLDFARDLEAAVRYLEDHASVDKDLVGALGHSEGGLIAPMMANREPGLDFAILLAPPGVTGEEIIISQTEVIARLNGSSRRDISENSALQRALYGVLKESLGPEEEREKMYGIMEEVIGNQPEAIETQIQRIRNTWTRHFVLYDPKRALAAIECPTLALLGEKDRQVVADINLPAIEEAFSENKNEDVTVQEIAGANHLFQIAQTGLPSEYATIEETISPQVLELITDWLEKILP